MMRFDAIAGFCWTARRGTRTTSGVQTLRFGALPARVVIRVGGRYCGPWNGINGPGESPGAAGGRVARFLAGLSARPDDRAFAK